MTIDNLDQQADTATAESQLTPEKAEASNKKWDKWDRLFYGGCAVAALGMAQLIRTTHVAYEPRRVHVDLQPVQPQATLTPDPCRTVTVGVGDSFWRIAERELGDGNLYPTLQAQNPNTGGLEPGEELQVCDGTPTSLTAIDIAAPSAETETVIDLLQVPRLNDKELPADVIGRGELATRYRTFIHDAPGVNLHLRKGGLDYFSIFESLKNGEVERLDIVLVDADNVRADSMTPEQQAQLPDFYNVLLAGDMATPDPSKVDIHMVGKYWLNEGRIYIIVAVGGHLKPDSNQSHPPASEFGLSHSQNYPYGGATPAITLRHELMHFTAGKAKNSGMHPETLTDYLALESIRQAEIQYAGGNDFLYSIVFETADGNMVSEAPKKPEKKIIAGARAHTIKGHSTEAFRRRANARVF